MDAKIARFALDRVPLSLIIDDSTALVNLNYFWLRDRNTHTGENQRWEDIPVVIPELFIREFAEWCLQKGVKGKFSMVPCPAAIGPLDEDLPLFTQKQVQGWLDVCRDIVVENFDITPEMLTHSFVVDHRTLKPLPSRIWEQYEWSRLEDYDLTVDYIHRACEILVNIGLPPEGVTSPGGFGGKTLALYARAAGTAVREVTGRKTPFFFKRVSSSGKEIEIPVWYADQKAGTAVGEIIAATGDRTGSWTGYDPVDADYYITADLQGGRIPEVIEARQPCVLCSHWQGFYGLHNGDRRGFKTLKTVYRRIAERDPHGENCRWRKVSEITDYTCMRKMAELEVEGNEIRVELPVKVPELTLVVKDLRPDMVRGIKAEDKPLKRVAKKRHFETGTYYVDDDRLLLAYNPRETESTITIQK